jgi:hypothetical protein
MPDSPLPLDFNIHLSLKIKGFDLSFYLILYVDVCSCSVELNLANSLIPELFKFSVF